MFKYLNIDVNLFNAKLKIIEEGLKDPKDNPCWKGYKPVGTKQLRGKQVPNCVPVEEKKTDRKELIKQFLSYAIKKLGIKNAPKVILNTDKDRVNKLRSMAGYMPGENKVWIYIGNRNIADIIRSLAHELVHCSQFEKRAGERIDGTTGSDDENEANAVSGILLRLYGQEHPGIYE